MTCIYLACLQRHKRHATDMQCWQHACCLGAPELRRTLNTYYVSVMASSTSLQYEHQADHTSRHYPFESMADMQYCNHSFNHIICKPIAITGNLHTGCLPQPLAFFNSVTSCVSPVVSANRWQSAPLFLLFVATESIVRHGRQAQGNMVCSAGLTDPDIAAHCSSIQISEVTA